VTFAMPSAAQNRLTANGRSAEATSTATPGIETAFSLNFRVSVAQVPVSRLGTVRSTNVLPAKSFFVVCDRSDFTSVKSGAGRPFTGSSPARRTGAPFNVTAVMAIASDGSGRRRGC